MRRKSFFINKLVIVFVMLFGLVLRVWHLDIIPPGLANDEANIILNAQSLIHTGKNIPGVITGILGSAAGEAGGGIHSELSSYYLALVYFVSGFSQATVRLPFALAGLGILFFIYLISKKLFDDKTAFVVLLLGAINPWLIQFSRAGYEVVFACLFYLISIYLFLKLKGWKIIWTFLFLLLGYLSYFSAKTLILPISLSFLIISNISKTKKDLKPTIALNILIVLFLVIYFALLTKSPAGARINEVSNNNFSKIVDYGRTHSIDFPLQVLVENKIVENFFYRTGAALGGVSPTFLFINGLPESSGHLQIPNQGPLYLIDFIFVISGFMFLARKELKKLFFLGFLILATLLPNFVDIANSTYTIRPVILIPILTLISAYGIVSLIDLIKKKKIVGLSIIAVVAVYGFFFLRFVFQYYYRLPIEESNAFFFQDRIATHYVLELEKNKPQQKVVWVTTSPKYSFYRFIFFGNLYLNSEQIKFTNAKLVAEDYSLGSLEFKNNCPKVFSKDTLYIVDSTVDCNLENSPVVIPNINDAGAKYKLSSDPLCSNHEHRRYPLIKDFGTLNLDGLSNTEFCDNYITSN